MLLLEALPTLPELRLVLDLVGGADALNAALACRDFKTAIFARTWERVDGKRKITVLADVMTVAKLQHARALGCPWDARTCAAAAAAGALDVLRLARAEGCSWDHRTATEAARHGHLALLRWAVAEGCGLDTAAINAAARGGHLAVIQELRDRGLSWHPETTASAAAGGHLELLKWAIAHDARWSPSACFEAAGSGSVELLVWASDHGAPLRRGDSVGGGCKQNLYVSVHGGDSMYAIAACNGHVDTLDWLRSKEVPWPRDNGDWGPPCDISDGLYACAAYGGHQAVIEWLEAHGVVRNAHGDATACEAAADGGHLELLQWMRSRSSPYAWNQDTCKAAAANGHLDLLRWAHENGAPWHREWNGQTQWCIEMVQEAAEGGHLDCLKWIFNHGFPRDLPDDELQYVAMYAFDCKQPHVLQWLEENGFPMGLVEERKVRTAPGGDLHSPLWPASPGSSASPGPSASGPSGFTGPGSTPTFAKALDGPAAEEPGRLGALLRGEYVIVVQCACAVGSFCNCHVTIFWRDEAGVLQRDREEMFKSGLAHVLTDLIPFCGGAYSEYADHGEPPATDLARGVVDLRVSELARIGMLCSEFWSAVRIFLEAAAAGVEPEPSDLPRCVTRFMQQAPAGRVVRLSVQGEAAARAAVDALGGHWPSGDAYPLVW